jgi:hypothetical protein
MKLSEPTSLNFRSSALLRVKGFGDSELKNQIREATAIRKMMRRVERTMPSSKQGVKSNDRKEDTGPQPSLCWPLAMDLHVAIGEGNNVHHLNQLP